MRTVLRPSTWLILAGALASAAYGRQNLALNGSMEIGPGPGGPDDRVPLNWTTEGANANIIQRNSQYNYSPPAGGWVLKIYAGAASPLTAYEEVAVVPGDAIRISARCYTSSTDHISNGATANIKLGFYNGGTLIGGSETTVTVLNENSAGNTWTLGQIGPINAPVGATQARFTCEFVHLGGPSGSAFWDDCQLTINNGPNALLNGDFELSGTSEDNPFGITNWTAFQFGRKSAEQALDGDYSAKVSVSTVIGDYSGIYQDTSDIGSGDRIYVTAWVYNPLSDGLNGAAAAAIKMEFFPQGGGSLPPSEEHLVFDSDDPVDTWVQVSYSTVVPDGVTVARVTLISNDTQAANGAVYFDDAFAERSSDPGVNKLQNSSMESGLGGINGIANWTEFRSTGCQARKNTAEVPARTGSFVCKVSGSCVAGIHQDVDAVPGETITISAWLRQTAATPFGTPPGSTAGVKVEWRNSGVPPQIDIDGAPGNTLRVANAPAGQWTNAFIDHTMPPATAANLRITCIMARFGVASSTTYFDNYEAVWMNHFNGSDVDADDDEDLVDFSYLQRCYNGAGGGLGWPCIVYDQDDDDDIDQPDANFFYPRMTGPSLN